MATIPKSAKSNSVVRLLAPPTVAEMLGVSEDTLRGWRCAPKPTGPRFCRLSKITVRYKERDVLDWIESLPKGGTK